MLQNKDQQYKDNFSITLNGKEIKHKPRIKILDNLLSESLTWESHIQTVHDFSALLQTKDQQYKEIPSLKIE